MHVSLFCCPAVALACAGGVCVCVRYACMCVCVTVLFCPVALQKLMVAAQEVWCVCVCVRYACMCVTQEFCTSEAHGGSTRGVVCVCVRYACTCNKRVLHFRSAWWQHRRPGNSSRRKTGSWWTIIRGHVRTSSLSRWP